MTRSSASELKKLLSGINTPLTPLKGLGRSVEHWDDLIVFYMLNLLDNNSRRQLEIYYNTYCYSLPPPTTEIDDNAVAPLKATSSKIVGNH